MKKTDSFISTASGFSQIWKQPSALDPAHIDWTEGTDVVLLRLADIILARAERGCTSVTDAVRHRRTDASEGQRTMFYRMKNPLANTSASNLKPRRGKQ